MTATIQSLWRHPIKAHGRESLDEVALIAGQCLPGDRVWAVAHEAARVDGTEWVKCGNFTRAAGSPQLMAISARTEGDRLVMMHPDRPDLRFDPEADEAAFLDWVRPLMPDGRAAPTRIIRVPGVGMTDSSWPSLTLCNMATHRAVEQKLGHELSIHRWRGNIWFDGFPDWAEFDWIGQQVKIGEAILQVRERTTRCLATTVNPDTGERDADTLGTLEQNWGHKDFSVKAEVIQGGQVRVGDKLELL
ncbi:MOSC domain-containing protein [Ruegeria sp. 2205SS24-7]|uniref:MOSC domain-containing protein n=1 Tax=Ruegeria discodermiae TaxID=3064389 RepID=UPI002741EB7A|nr:MOSC N-terminal beta barrel domain-containing protein [Ruegeria sp. 2205SS24-7]MDP5220122.1 MOSC domain-containing protein [Ruegeria sp. 2205SS24-7]